MAFHIQEGTHLYVILLMNHAASPMLAHSIASELLSVINK